MTIVQHNFNDSGIPQTAEDLNLNGNLIPRGYVNATAMCKPYGKLWSNYWKTDKAKSFASRLQGLKSLETTVISIYGGNDKSIQGTWIHLDIAKHLLSWLQQNDKSCGHNKSEAKVRDTLNSRLRGEIEVLTPSGRIDILTSRELIEVKEAANWKAAVGQVIVYGYYYPSHSKRIHLFGTVHSRVKSEIEIICSRNNITVTWE